MRIPESRINQSLRTAKAQQLPGLSEAYSHRLGALLCTTTLSTLISDCEHKIHLQSNTSSLLTQPQGSAEPFTWKAPRLLLSQQVPT